MVLRIDLHSIVFEEKSDGWCQGDITGHNRQGEAHNSNSKIKSIKNTEDFPEYYLQKSPRRESNFSWKLLCRITPSTLPT